MDFSPWAQFEHDLAYEHNLLSAHPIYAQLKGLSQLRLFMRNHVFAVWDFMSLLKSLQLKLTCVELPWLPCADATISRLINEIVLAEESDLIGPGHACSHFELYREAMLQLKADTQPIDVFLSGIRQKHSPADLLGQLPIAPATVQFVCTTLELSKLEAHQVAAAFFFGREDLIPSMFERILMELSAAGHPQLDLLKLYLQRHIEVDSSSHGPAAKKMLTHLCENSSQKWAQARAAAVAAVSARRALWDGIMGEITGRSFS